jgi:hypothetical protein
VKNHRPALSQLAAAVAITATTFGLRAAEAHTEGSGYYVLYNMPCGRLTRTQTSESRNTVLRAFKQAVITASISKN